MQTNLTKAKLKAGETVLGCFVRYPDATLIEVLGYQPWDFLVFDGEHGPIDPRDCENMARAAELRGVTPIVRVTTNQPSVILRYMDSGVHGLIVPWVNNAEEAEAVVRSVKYHPRGNRGLAGVRASDYSQLLPLSEYVQVANAETLITVQIERAEAIKNLPEILAVADIDVVFIGPNDLSQSLGYPGQPQHPAVQEAMQQITDQVKQSQAALGIMVKDAAAAREWRARGARFISIGFESVLMPAVKNYLQEVRA